MKRIICSMILGSLIALTGCAHHHPEGGGEGKTECGCKKSCCDGGSCKDGSCGMKKPDDAASAPKAK